MTDIRLLELMKQHPDRGIEKLINMYSGLVYSVIRGRLEGTSYISSDIEDLVADTFSKFYLELKSFDPKKSSIKAYLCVIARNNAVDLIRRLKIKHGCLEIDDENNIIQISNELYIESSEDEKETADEVLSEVLRLPEPDKSIIFRKYYYGQSSKEIAKALRLTPSNVDTRAHRAINKLKEHFKQKEKR